MNSRLQEAEHTMAMLATIKKKSVLLDFGGRETFSCLYLRESSPLYRDCHVHLFRKKQAIQLCHLLANLLAPAMVAAWCTGKATGNKLGTLEVCIVKRG